MGISAYEMGEGISDGYLPALGTWTGSDGLWQARPMGCYSWCPTTRGSQGCTDGAAQIGPGINPVVPAAPDEMGSMGHVIGVVISRG
jgi:hypothetical protein